MIARTFFVVALVAMTPSHLLAAPQVAPPAVTGVVKDTAGNPLAGVRVTVTQLNRVALTNASGSFRFTGLPAGTYHLISVQIGYAPGHADVVIPATGPDLALTITMRHSAVVVSELQVTATPIGTDPRNLSQSTLEVSGQTLARNVTTSIAQTLSSEPGIAVRYNGPAATTPVIRGLTGERVLVLHDGDRTGDLSAASQDHGVSIDPMVAERIEVVRGPASLLYGNSALGGVVNVITNDIPTSIPSSVRGFFNGQAESVTPGGATSGGVTIPVGESFAVVARGGGRRVDDLRQGSGLRLDNSFYHNYYGIGGFGFASGGTSGGAVYRGYRFNYGLPSADNEGAHIVGHRDELAGHVELAPASGMLKSVRVNGTAQWYAHDEIESTGEIRTAFNLKTQTMDALGRTRAGKVSGALGVSALLKQYAATGAEALTPAANSRGTGVFFYEDVPLSGTGDPDDRVVRLQFGGRYDAYRIESMAGDPKFGPAQSLSFNNFSGSVGLNFPVGRVVNVGLSAARAFRAPTVEELFSNANHEAAGTFDKGNPTLKSEVNSGFDATIRAQSSKVTAQLGGFYSRINNFITPNIVKDTTLDDGGIVPLNEFSQGEATLRGLEGRIEAEVASHLVIGAMGDMVRGSLRGGEALPFIPAARLGALIRWDNGRVIFSAEERHAFEQSRVPAAATDDDPSAVATGSYDLVNISVGVTVVRDIRNQSITLRIDNLFDKLYREASSRIKSFAFNPGRNITLLYRVQL